MFENQPLEERVIEVKQLEYGFHSDTPFFQPGWDMKVERRRSIECSPRPAYPHSAEAVRRHLLHVESLFPVERRPLVYLPSYDSSISNRNAATFEEGLYNEPVDEHNRAVTASYFVMYGKGTPIHPAVTKYLVAHEYGHVVAEVLAHAWSESSDPRPSFMRHYAELRGMKDLPRNYGLAQWHKHPEEVFANDFRILVAGLDADWWPHEAPHPHSLPNLKLWWDARAQEARNGLKHFKEAALS